MPNAPRVHEEWKTAENDNADADAPDHHGLVFVLVVDKHVSLDGVEKGEVAKQAHHDVHGHAQGQGACGEGEVGEGGERGERRRGTEGGEMGSEEKGELNGETKMPSRPQGP